MDLQVNRSDLHETRLVDTPIAPLEAGQARLRVDSFGLSANNITYAVMGDFLQYWNFFPAPEGWGRVPVWGFADVAESRHDDVAVGQRVFGYLPMSTELVVTVGRAGPGEFVDVAESGSGAARAAVHARYGSALRHDMILGGTHHTEIADAGELAGPEPTFFFAPDQIAKRVADGGQDTLDARLDEAWQAFVPWTDGWLEFRPTAGLDAVAAIYLELLDNRLAPTVAPICSPTTES